MELLQKIAEALLDAFGVVIAEYPLMALIVFGIVFFYLVEKGYIVLKTGDEGWPIIIKDVAAFLVGFIVAVLITRILGPIFDGVMFIVGKLTGLGGTFADLFARNPLEFTIVFVAIGFILAVYTAFQSWRLKRRVGLARIAWMGLLLLLSTYIVTSIYVAASEDESDQTAADKAAVRD